MRQNGAGVDVDAIEQAMRAILTAIGEDPTREGLRDTPKRYAKFLREWVSPPPFEFTAFDAEGHGQMVVQNNIPFVSMCEHHTLPFVGTAVVGYLPGKKIVGLSKLARAVEHCARGFQNQERITEQVADMIEKAIEPRGVGVVLRAEHMCMTIRGVRAHGSRTLTSALRGEFLTDLMMRTEFQTYATEGQR